MKRSDFLKGIGLAAGSAILPSAKSGYDAKTYKLNLNGPTACTLIPSETEGPYPLDLSANNFYFRKDIRETATGVLLTVKMRIIGADNCLPMKNARVNIWHCDKAGNYSGYGTEVGKTYLRGYQMTDANGDVEFTTVFPNWYNGRICHIHFQVYMSTVYAAISQFSFPIAAKNAIYAANTTVYTKGADPKTFDSDMIFSDGYALQVATLTPNTATGGYETFLEVTVKGGGALAAMEPETGGQFTLGQNFPNPFLAETTVPFTLINRADVALELYDLTGKKVATVNKTNLAPGDHEIEIGLKPLGLPVANYAYQLKVSNGNGMFAQTKLMTAF